MRPPLGFRGKLEGSIDIKKNGLVPIQNLARYYAFASGITSASTLERLIAVRDVVGESVESRARAARGVRRACSTCSCAITPTACVTAAPVDNIIETWTLPPLTRASLQEALREIVSAQKRFKPVVGAAHRRSFYRAAAPIAPRIDLERDRRVAAAAVPQGERVKLLIAHGDATSGTRCARWRTT